MAESTTDPAGTDAAADLVLYVSPESHASLKARANLAAIVERYGPGRVRYEVCDVSQDPGKAEADRILFTPTLVLKAGAPAWVVGDLSNHAAVIQLLRLKGIEDAT